MGKSSVEFRFELTNSQEPGEETRSGSSSIGEQSTDRFAGMKQSEVEKVLRAEDHADAMKGKYEAQLEGFAMFDDKAGMKKAKAGIRRWDKKLKEILEKYPRPERVENRAETISEKQSLINAYMFDENLSREEAEDRANEIYPDEPESVVPDEPDASFNFGANAEESDERAFLEETAKDLFIDPSDLSDNDLIAAIQQARSSDVDTDYEVQNPTADDFEAERALNRFETAKLEKGRYSVLSDNRVFEIKNEGKTWNLYSPEKEMLKEFKTKKAAISFVEEGTDPVLSRKLEPETKPTKKSRKSPKKKEPGKRKVGRVKDRSPRKPPQDPPKDKTAFAEPPDDDDSKDEAENIVAKDDAKGKPKEESLSFDNEGTFPSARKEPVEPPKPAEPKTPELSFDNDSNFPPTPPKPPQTAFSDPGDDDDDADDLDEETLQALLGENPDKELEKLNRERAAEERRLKRYEIMRLSKEAKFDTDVDYRGNTGETTDRRANTREQFAAMKGESDNRSQVTATDRIVRRLGAFGIARSIGGSGQLLTAAMEIGVFNPEEQQSIKEEEARQEYFARKQEEISLQEKKYSEFIQGSKAAEKAAITERIDDARFRLNEGEDVDMDMLHSQIEGIKDNFASERKANAPSGDPFTDMPDSFSSGGNGKDPKSFIDFLKSSLDFDTLGEGLDKTTLTILKANIALEGLNLVSGVLTSSIKGLGSVLASPENLENTVSVFAGGVNTAAKFTGAGIGAYLGYEKFTGQDADIPVGESVDENPLPDEEDEDSGSLKSQRRSRGPQIDSPAFRGPQASSEPPKEKSPLESKPEAQDGPSSKPTEPGSGGKAASSLGGAAGGALGTVLGGAVGGAIGSAVAEPLMALVESGVSMMNRIADESIAPETLIASLEGELKLFNEKIERDFNIDEITAGLVESRTELSAALIDFQEVLIKEFGDDLKNIIQLITLLVKTGSTGVEVMSAIHSVTTPSGVIGMAMSAIMNWLPMLVENTEKETNTEDIEDKDIEEGIKQFFSQSQFRSENNELAFNNSF